LGDANLYFIAETPNVPSRGYGLLRNHSPTAQTDPRPLRATTQRHKGSFNVGFCDGHLERIEQQKLFASSAAAARRWHYDNEP
jgi:prepilin-type processing-associated H-X9-DG protein